MKLTELEKDALGACWRSEYSDGGENPSPWSWSVTDSCKVATTRQVPGVIASLIKKGLLSSHGAGEEAYVYVTDAGFAAARDSGIITPDTYIKLDKQEGTWWRAAE